MPQNRAGEEAKVPFRNERYFCANGAWYFEVRGGGQKGPFNNKQDMEGELFMYIREQNLLKNSISKPS